MESPSLVGGFERPARWARSAGPGPSGLSMGEPEMFRLQSRRLMTFSAALSNHSDRRFYTPAMRHAVAGFIYIPSSRRLRESYVACPWCRLSLRKIHASHSPLVWHRVLSKACPFILRNNNIDQQDLATVTIHARRPTAAVGAQASPVAANLTLHGNGGQLLTARPDDGEVSGTRDEVHHITLNSSPSELMDIYKANTNSLLDIVPVEFLREIAPVPANSTLSLPGDYYERNRMVSFRNWPKGDIVSAQSLAAMGMKYLGRGDVVECVYCKVKLDGWTVDMNPLNTHILKAPECAMVQGSLLATNVPDMLTDIIRPGSDRLLSRDLGIITDTSAHPGFAVAARRESSFLTWPHDNTKLASEMIEHMLYYSGTADKCICFSCGAEMSGWDSGESVWVRHARTSPNCQILLQEQGQEFVTSTLQEHGAYSAPGRQPTINVVTTRMIRPRMDSRAAQSVLSLHPQYMRDEVKTALTDNIKYGGQDYTHTEQIITSILNQREETRKLNLTRQEADDRIAPPEIVHLPVLTELVEGDDTEAEETEQGGDTEMVTDRHSLHDEESPPPSEPAENEDNRPITPPQNPRELVRTLKSQLSCKICLDQAVGIIFLPCGHAACCVSCAPAMLQCPMCRHDVNGTIRVHLDKL